MDVVRKEAILVDLKSTDKKGVIEEMVAPLARLAGVGFEDLAKVLMERERLGSTGIGGGVGIPHGKMKHLDQLMLGVGISKRGVDFESIDGKPTHLFFMLVTPENSIDAHLRLLAKISRILKNEVFKQRLMNATDGEAVASIIAQEDGA